MKPTNKGSVLKYLLLVCAVVLIATGTARAEESALGTIQDLYTNCQDRAPLGYWGWCMGYLLGVADTMAEGHGPQRICVGNYTAAMLQPVFINWAEKHPKRWQEDRWTGATAALREAWPCQ